MGLNLRTSSERIKVPCKMDQESYFLVERGNPRIAKKWINRHRLSFGTSCTNIGTKELQLYWGSLQRETADV